MKWFGILGFLLILALSQKVQGQSATVTWGTTHQTMDGFGGQTWLYSPTYSKAQMDTFYSSTSGIGLQIIRTSNWGCYISYPTSACPVVTSNMPELTTVANAVSDGAVVELNIQPPANLKVSGSFTVGTAGSNGSCVASADFSALVTFTIDWIEMMNANGASVTYLFPFNEPDQPDQLGGCAWTAASEAAYIDVLGPALAAAGLGSIKIGIGENSGWFAKDYVSTCLADSTCASYVSIVSAHGYGTAAGSPDGFTPKTGYCCATASSPPSYVAAWLAATPSHRLWMDEINGGFTYNSTVSLWTWDPSTSDAMVWARNIHDYLTVAGVSGYNYWELTDCCVTEPGSGGPLNDGLTESDPSTVSTRYYVFGNWARFIGPKWVRIDTTTNPQTGVYVTAFKDPGGTSYSIVALNSNSSATSQTFDLSGFPITASVTPYTTTSSEAGLVEQTSVVVSSGTVTYTLPALSVTSFVGSTAATSVTGPAPPTALTDSVR
jgi:glucuronoarabinoxylan endo-1,4-beta-xylanase